MTRILKWLGLAVAVVIALLAGIAALLYLVIDEQKLRASVTDVAARQFGAVLRIDGELSISMLPSPELGVADIGLRMSADDPAELATARLIRLRLRIPPLLRGELAFDEAAVEGLTIHAVREADGRANWQPPIVASTDARAGTAEATASPAPASAEVGLTTHGAGGAALAIARVSVSEAIATLENRGTGSTHRLELTSLRGDGFNLGNTPFALTAQGRVTSGSGERLETAGFSIDAKAALDAAGGGITLTDANLQFAPAGSEPLNLQAGSLAAGSGGTLEVRQATLSRGALSLSELDADLMTEADATVLRSLKARIYEGTLEAKGRAGQHGAGELRVEAKLAGTDIRALLRALGQPERMEGRLDATLALHATGTTSAQWKASLAGPVSLRVQDPVLHELSVEQMICKAAAALNKESLTAQFEPLTRLDGLESALEFRSGVGEFRTLSATLPNMALAGKGQIDLPQRKLKIHVDTRITRDLADRDPACRMTNKMLRVEWPITCRGSFNEDPKQWCGIDSDDLAKIATQVATEKFGDKLKDKLRGLFGND